MGLNIVLNDLSGLFFHTFTEDGEISMQGKVISHDRETDTLKIETYSWASGDPYSVEIREGGWAEREDVTFYKTNQDMHQAYADERGLPISEVSRDYKE